MMVRYPITLVYLALGLAVVATPLYWWTYDFGGLLIINTSPFQFTITLLGVTLEISGLITAILEAYRAYLIIILARNIYLVAMKGGAGKDLRNCLTINSIPHIPTHYLLHSELRIWHVPRTSEIPTGAHGQWHHGHELRERQHNNDNNNNPPTLSILGGPNHRYNGDTSGHRDREAR